MFCISVKTNHTFGPPLECLNVAIGPLSFNFQALVGAKSPGQALFSWDTSSFGSRGRGLAVKPYFTRLDCRTSILTDDDLE